MEELYHTRYWCEFWARLFEAKHHHGPRSLVWAYVRSKRNEIFYRISQTSCDDYDDRGKNQVGFAHSRDGLFLGSSTGNESTSYTLGTGENLRLKKSESRRSLLCAVWQGGGCIGVHRQHGVRVNLYLVKEEYVRGPNYMVVPGC